MQIVLIIISALMYLPCFAWGTAADVTPITVTTLGGSVLRVEPAADSFTFGVIQPDGTTKPRVIKFNEIRELLLVENPVANIQKEIVALVEQLGGNDFVLRELAEEKLSESDFAGRFEKLLRTYRDDPNLEIRYRIRRILANLVDSASPPASQDRLILKTGERLTGDANALQINGSWLGTAIQLDRPQIRQVSSAAPRTLTPPATDKVEVKKFLSHVKQFYFSGYDSYVDFEDDPYGNSLSLSANLNETFIPQGLKLSSNNTDYVRSVRFSFKHCPLDSGSKSACVQGERMFRGVMHIRFCLPGQPDVSAGVTRFGMFMERVDNPRDFVVEAFDANGNIVSLVEATDQDCCFAGFQSNIPITEIRVQQNPYLVNLKRELDEMYAVDNLTFDRPIPVASSSEHPILKLKSGNYLAVTKLEMKKQTWQVTIAEIAKPIAVATKDIAWYQTGNPVTNKPKHWRALLTDGSVVAGKMGEMCPATPESSPDQPLGDSNTYLAVQDRDIKRGTAQDVFQPLESRLSIEANQIVALWPAGKPAIFPQPQDFPTEHPVLVYPGCRILSKNSIFFFRDAMFWPVDCQEKVQEVNLSDTTKDKPLLDIKTEPLLHSHIQGVGQYKALYDNSNAPSIWFGAPTIIQPNRGHLTTVSGDRYVFWPGGRFEFKSITNQQILLTFAGGELTIPLQDVSQFSLGQ